MTYTSLRRTQTQTDLLAFDHVAECPDCHELAHPTQTVCDGCGSALFPKEISNGPGRSDLDGTSAAGAERRTIPMVKDCTCGNAGTCTRCTLAEYDGELPAPSIRATLHAHDTLESALARKPAELALVRDEPGDDYLTRRGPHLMDSRSENDRSL